MREVIPGRAGAFVAKEMFVHMCAPFPTQYIRATFNSDTGLLMMIENMEQTLSLPVKQGFFW